MPIVAAHPWDKADLGRPEGKCRIAAFLEGFRRMDASNSPRRAGREACRQVRSSMQTVDANEANSEQDLSGSKSGRRWVSKALMVRMGDGVDFFLEEQGDFDAPVPARSRRDEGDLCAAVLHSMRRFRSTRCTSRCSSTVWCRNGGTYSHHRQRSSPR